MGFARGFNALGPSASWIYVSGSLGWLVPPWHPKTRLNTNLCSESTFLAPEGTCYSKRPLQGHLVLQAPFFPAGFPKIRKNPEYRAEPAPSGRGTRHRRCRVNLVLPAPLFRGNPGKTRNTAQSPRHQGGTVDAEGVNRNRLKFGHSAVRPSAADPFCGSRWEKSWRSRGPEAALASPQKSPHPTAGDPICCSLWEKSWGSRGPEAALASPKKSPR